MILITVFSRLSDVQAEVFNVLFLKGGGQQQEKNLFTAAFTEACRSNKKQLELTAR